MPSSVIGMISAHHAAGQEYQSIDAEPGDKEKPDGQHGEGQNVARDAGEGFVVLAAAKSIRLGCWIVAQAPSTQGFSVSRYAMMFCRCSASGTLMTIFVP